MPHFDHKPDPSAAQDEKEFAQFLDEQDPTDAEAARWLVRRNEGLSALEEAEYQQWLNEDEKNAEAMAGLEELWGQLDELPDEDVEALKASLPERSTPPPMLHNTPKPVPAAQPTPARTHWLEGFALLIPRLAVLSFTISILGAGWLGWQSWQRQPTFVQAYHTERGQQRKISLPDGSQLWLDAASKAEVRLYRNRREVQLPQGQAMFTVQANPQQPFDVLAGPLRVTVVGTRFAVRNAVAAEASNPSLDPQSNVSVAVEEGRVRVSRLDSAHETETILAELGAGHSISTDSTGEITAMSTAVTNAAPWREGRIVFENTTLALALAEFERYGNTGLIITDPAVAQLKISGSYNLHGLPAFIKALPKLLPVRLQKNSAGQTEITMAR